MKTAFRRLQNIEDSVLDDESLTWGKIGEVARIYLAPPTAEIIADTLRALYPDGVVSLPVRPGEYFTFVLRARRFPDSGLDPHSARATTDEEKEKAASSSRGGNDTMDIDNGKQPLRCFRECINLTRSHRLLDVQDDALGPLGGMILREEDDSGSVEVPLIIPEDEPPVQVQVTQRVRKTAQEVGGELVCILYS